MKLNPKNKVDTGPASPGTPLADPKVLDQSVSDVMDQPFPVVESDQPVESVAKLLSKSNRAVLMKKDGVVQGIVTRFDVLEHLMHR